MFRLSIASSEERAAVLEFADPVGRLTLMGPKSGIPVTPGLKWASFNLIAEDLHAMRERLSDAGSDVGAVNGDDQI